MVLVVLVLVVLVLVVLVERSGHACMTSNFPCSLRKRIVEEGCVGVVCGVCGVCVLCALCVVEKSPSLLRTGDDKALVRDDVVDRPG